MPFALDLSPFRDAVQRVRAAAPVAVAANLPVAALVLVVDPPYTAPQFDETGPGPDPEELLTDLQTSGTAAMVGIGVLYDWVLDPAHQHCASGDGLDCPTIAAGGPYTLDTLLAQPGDGTTPCGSRCYCQLSERDPTWEQSGAEVLATLGADLWQDLTQAWEA